MQNWQLEIGWAPGVEPSTSHPKSWHDVERAMKQTIDGREGLAMLIDQTSRDYMLIGIEADQACVQFRPLNPPSLPDAQLRPVVWATVRSGDPAKAKDEPPVEFNFGGTATEISQRHCIPVQTALEVFKHYFDTGELSQTVRWESEDLM